MSVVLASVSPIAVRLAARSLDRLGTVAGRLFSISTAGSIAGTFVTAFWLVPEYGTDQVLAVGAMVLLAAAAVVALLQRLWLPGAALVVAAGATLLAVGALSPDTTGRGRQWGGRAELVAALPRARGSDAAQARSRGGRALGLGLHGARGARHALPPPLRDGRRELAISPLRQLVPERHVPRRPGSDALFVQRLPPPRSRLQPEREADPRRRPRRGLDAEAALPGLQGRRDHDRRARPGGRLDRLQVVQAAAQPARRRRGGRRPPVPPAARRPLRRDHGRRLLLGRRPVPPDDARVRRADEGAADARRRDRDERDRRADRRELADHARALEDLRRRLPDGRAAPGVRGAVGPPVRRHPEHHPRRHRARVAVPRPPRRHLERGAGDPRARRSRPHGGRPATAGSATCGRATSRC